MKRDWCPNLPTHTHAHTLVIERKYLDTHLEFDAISLTFGYVAYTEQIKPG